MSITDERFVEVLKGLTQEDFDAVQNTFDQLVEKFDSDETKSLFTENEMKTVSKLTESNSGEVLLGVMVTKFNEEI